MGKGGKGKPKASSEPSEDELLEAAIKEASGLRLKAEEAAKNAKPETPWAKTKPKGKTERKPARRAALTRQQIIQKLNAIPTFCLLNGEKNIIGIDDGSGEGREACFWFLDADDARQVFAVVRAQNPGVEVGLGVTPLGLAFALACGWEEATFDGDLRLQASPSALTAAPELQAQLEAQGLEAFKWVLPTFVAAELETPSCMPVFLNRTDLAHFWQKGGRPKETVPEQLAVVELRVLVAQMQTDAFAWSTLEFVVSQRAIALAKEIQVARQSGGEIADGPLRVAVTVPEGATTGTALQVKTPRGIAHVTVPPGVAVGESFSVMVEESKTQPGALMPLDAPPPLEAAPETPPTTEVLEEAD